MCRILGAVGRELDSPFIENVFLESEHMGRDATGFWTPNTNIIKGPKKVSEFLPTVKESFETGLANSNVFIGHTRLATHGEPSFNYNNHPIESENWIIVHNGIVGTMKDVKEYPYQTDTDTENILAYIETFGIVEGLKYCSSSAAIILVKKDEENTLYVWRTYSSDMAIAYDPDRENLYISSGLSYFQKALAPEVKKIERLGGLFTVTERRMKSVEPTPRELWKLYYKNNQVFAEAIEKISTHTQTSYYRNGKWTSKFNGGEDPNAHLFAEAGWGDNRPGVVTGRKQKEEKRHGGYGTWNPQTRRWEYDDYDYGLGYGRGYSSQRDRSGDTETGNGSSKKSITKASNQTKTPNNIYKGDIVKLVRNLQPTDTVTSATPNKLSSLSIDQQFKVSRFLCHNRVVIEREDGEIFVAPYWLLEDAPSPTCLGIRYLDLDRCEHCLHADICLEVLEAYKDIPKPSCVGNYDPDDDNCVQCLSLTYCLYKNEEFIDAEFKEANEAVQEESTDG